jgi:hypothetical protein
MEMVQALIEVNITQKEREFLLHTGYLPRDTIESLKLMNPKDVVFPVDMTYQQWDILLDILDSRQCNCLNENEYEFLEILQDRIYGKMEAWLENTVMEQEQQDQSAADTWESEDEDQEDFDCPDFWGFAPLPDYEETMKLLQQIDCAEFVWSGDNKALELFQTMADSLSSMPLRMKNEIILQILSAQCSTIDELNRFLNQSIFQYSNQKQDWLLGMSYIQLDFLLNWDWKSENPVIWINDSLPQALVSGADLYRQSHLMLEMIAEQSPRLTARNGILNQAFIEEFLEQSAIHPRSGEKMQAGLQFVQGRDEIGFNTIRSLLQRLRLIGKMKDHLRITRKGSEMLEAERAGKLFHDLFVQYYSHITLLPYPVLAQFQASENDPTTGVCLFIFYILSRKAHTWISLNKLAEIAHSALGDEMKNISEILKANHLLEHRIIIPLIHFNLLEIKEDNKNQFTHRSHVRKTPIFDEFLQFNTNFELSREGLHVPG